MARFVVVVAVFVVVLVAVTSAQIFGTSLCQLIRRGQCETACGQGMEALTSSYGLCPADSQCCIKKYVPETTTIPTSTHAPSWWSEWSPCSASCGNGTMSRWCLSNDLSLCNGTETETKECPRLPWCYSAKWGNWSEWGNCSVECGGGFRTRKIHCKTDDGTFSKECPCFDKEVLEESESCNNQTCPDKECGWRRVDKPTPRVVNGLPSAPCSWPWAVAFRGTFPRFPGTPDDVPPFTMTACSGVLVSPHYVLTTATCLKFTESLKASSVTWTLHLGDINMDSMDEGEKELKMENHTTFHPDFTGNGPQSKNNLALVRLTSPVTSWDCHRPVCLMDSLLTPLDTSKPLRCMVAGFGPTNATSTMPSRKMHEAEVEVLPTESCSLYDRNLDPDSDLICSYLFDKAKACANDEGSFLVCRHQGGQWVLRGVDVGLSASVDCSRFTPDYFVDVGKHLPWIRGVIGEL